MLINISEGLLRIKISGECTIAEVEADTDKLRTQFDRERVEGVEMNVGELQEIDTAYFQMVLSLKATADELGVSFRFSDRSPLLDELSLLYGVDIRGEAKISEKSAGV